MRPHVENFRCNRDSLAAEQRQPKSGKDRRIDGAVCAFAEDVLTKRLERGQFAWPLATATGDGIRQLRCVRC